ncbi:hypothetical protein [Neorhizobium sp. T7_12]|uniref:hypothetical protein n=1 Tax=Neorhizobium sp. T7_12 TaxID=2093832 RepID=UPI000CF8ACDC|nr:hypothetical protein [Neorhizobium sp. T7_12]
MRRLDLSDKQDFILAQRLLSLAAVLGIRRAILVLAHLVDPEREDERNSDLIFSLVEAVAAWPMVLHQETRQVLMRLAHANGFGELHARRALPALCKADPTGLSEYLRVLARPLHGRYASHLCRPIKGQRWNERQRRVKEVIAIVQDPAHLVASFEDWVRRIPQGEAPNSRALQYDWWASALEDEAIMDFLGKYGLSSQQSAAEPSRPIQKPFPRPTAGPLKTRDDLVEEGLVDAEDEAEANELFAERELEEA